MLGLSCSVQDLRCVRQYLSLWCMGMWWELRHSGSVVAARRLSCFVAIGILVPRPGIKSMSPALQGTFLTTGPSRNSPNLFSPSKLVIVITLVMIFVMTMQIYSHLEQCPSLPSLFRSVSPKHTATSLWVQCPSSWDTFFSLKMSVLCLHS